MSDLMLDVDQAGELKAAFRRGNWTNAFIKRLCEGDILSRVLLVLEGKAEIVIKKVEETAVSLLALVKTISTPAIAGKKTSDCFTNKLLRYCYRDGKLDSWLPESQPEQVSGEFSVVQLTKNAAFKQAVGSFLGITGDIQTLSQILKERGHITTLPVIESLIERQEAGEDVGLRTNGWANFFFVENKDGSVSVVNASRADRRWHVRVDRLGIGPVWLAVYRFFFRN